MGPAEYLRVLRARWWAIAALVLVGVSVAWITTPSKPSGDAQLAQFRASTVLVKGFTAPGDPASTTNLLLVSSLVSSPVVIERSATELSRPASALTSGLEASVNDKAGTLQISSVDADPALAVNEADTIAAQLLIYLSERRQQQLDPLITQTRDRIATLTDRVTALGSQFAPEGSSQADLLRTERESVLRQITASDERLQQLNSQAAANELVVLSPATAALDVTSSGFSAPTSRAARAGIGLVVGLLAGLALVVAFERINPKVRSTAQAEQVFGLPVIAEIPYRSRRSRRRGGITTFAEPHSVAAESYRGLRTALKYMPRTTDANGASADRFGGGHVVLVTSAAPSEGKTTVVANLAAGFAEKDGDVLVLSGDARQPAIETQLLGRRAAGARLASKGQSESVFTMIPGVKLALSCDPDANPADIVDFECEVVQQARSRSQTVIIDTPPALIANDAAELMHTADSIVLVARCGWTTVASARRIAELVARLHVTVVGVVLIGTDTAAVADSGYYRARPRRGVRQEVPRPRRMNADVGQRVPALSPPPPPSPSHFATPAPPPAESVAPPAPAPAPVRPVDNGGIWRPKTVIDLSGVDAPAPMQQPALPERSTARAPRATVGDGYPSRDTLAPHDGDLSRFEEQRRAYHAGNGRGAKLPLFRTGDANGNGRSGE